MVDNDSNTIGVKVVSEDGTICNKVNEDAGNAIAVAMDVLLGKTLPVGTKFHLNIDFDTEVFEKQLEELILHAKQEDKDIRQEIKDIVPTYRETV